MLKVLKDILQEELRQEKVSELTTEAPAQGYHVSVARQPVFDHKDQLWGYELLYRRSDNIQAANVTNGTVATANVIMDSFEIIRASLKKNQKILINFTSGLIESQISSLLPVENCVIEILENVQPTPKVLTSIAEIKKSGYTIALDDYVGQNHLKPFIPLSDIIKVDVIDLDQRQIIAILLDAKKEGFKGVFLAEKVENEKIATICRALGFSLFQGFFFKKPEIIKGKRFSPSQAVRIHILSLCVGDDIDFEAVNEAVMRDPLITAMFLKFVNSAYFSLTEPIKSVRHALALVGRITFMQWLCVAVMSTLGSSGSARDLAYLASQRAKFLENLGTELLSKKTPLPDVSTPDLFLAGLFSLLEGVMRVPLKEILDGVPVDGNVLSALSGEDSPYTRWLKIMDLYEQGRWDESIALARTVGLSENDLTNAYIKALDWSSTFTSV